MFPFRSARPGPGRLQQRCSESSNALRNILYYAIKSSLGMNDLLQNLLKLQTLEFGESADKNAETVIAGLRAKIPQPILGHYDRLRVRGKKGLAAVRNQVCTGCHMHVPIGVITTIMHGADIQLCGSCDRYLYLPEPAETTSSEQTAAAKPPAKKRKRKAVSHAA